MRTRSTILLAFMASACGGTVVSGAGGGNGSNTSSLDLPCDVASVVSSACIQCHGVVPAPGTVRLISGEDFAATSIADPTKTYGQQAVLRMKQSGVGRAMPPSGALSQSAISIVETWVAGGMPAGTCQTSGAGGGGGSATWDPGASGMPCEVVAFLSSKCVSCHGSGSPSVNLTTRDAFLAPSSVANQTKGQAAVARLASVSSPMPPSYASAATSVEIAAFSSWVDAGMPAGSCAGIDAGAPEPTCASNSFWSRGNKGSPSMNPGGACLVCHDLSREDENNYPFSGTVFPSLHEKNLCNAMPPSDVKVEIYDKNGVRALTMTPDPTSGNFNSNISVTVALPYTARVVSNAGVVEMTQPQMSGDCNGCHTVQGAYGAFGRVVWK